MGIKKESRGANPANSEIKRIQEDYTTKAGLKACFSVFKNSFDTEPVRETTLEELAADFSPEGGRP